MAKDSGTPFYNDTVDVEVDLIDINDCVPKFNSSEYTWPVIENDKVIRNIPLTIGAVEATDGDIGKNAEKTFKLAEPSKLFQVSLLIDFS